jgi:hypothetical protein
MRRRADARKYDEYDGQNLLLLITNLRSIIIFKQIVVFVIFSCFV